MKRIHAFGSAEVSYQSQPTVTFTAITGVHQRSYCLFVRSGRVGNFVCALMSITTQSRERAKYVSVDAFQLDRGERDQETITKVLLIRAQI